MKRMNIMSHIESKYIESLSIGSRSSKRTDLIHHGIGETVMDWFPDITYKIEQIKWIFLIFSNTIKI
jgi:hypothetical protein